MHLSYIELDIDAEQSLSEQMIAMLSELGFEGFWEDDRSLKCYIKSSRWQSRMLAEVQSLAHTLTRSSSSTAPRISVKEIHDQNWNEAWEKSIQPIKVTERIVIAPTWQPYTPLPGELLLTIDPKMSFGTGYHETTRLVLKLMEKHLVPGVTLLDVGTGTGVLAIAAIKLGAASAVGIDTDEWSYENAHENIRLNNVETAVQILQGDLASVPPRQFGMIVANIQRNVIAPLLPDLTARLLPGGMLLLSGLLLSDREILEGCFRLAGLSVVEGLRENEWLAFALHSAQS
jgi:ribosomal protein L11 methyltransferase